MIVKILLQAIQVIQSIPGIFIIIFKNKYHSYLSSFYYYDFNNSDTLTTPNAIRKNRSYSRTPTFYELSLEDKDNKAVGNVLNDSWTTLGFHYHHYIVLNQFDMNIF